MGVELPRYRRRSRAPAPTPSRSARDGPTASASRTAHVGQVGGFERAGPGDLPDDPDTPRVVLLVDDLWLEPSELEALQDRSHPTVRHMHALEVLHDPGLVLGVAL